MFHKGILVLDFDFDQFNVDLNSFFKLSSACREDYSSVSELTNIIAQYMIKHTSTRWLTLKFVGVRIIEQWENLHQYFFTFLSTQSNFKSSVKETARYKHICETLKHDKSILYISFMTFVGQISEKFLLHFQSETPLIHLLYPAMNELITDLMTKFVRKKYLHDKESA